MKFIPTLGLTAIGSVVLFIAVSLLQGALHTIFEFSEILHFLFSSCMAILFYRKSDTNMKLLKSIVISLMPFILEACFYVTFFLFLVICEDSFPVPD